MSVAVTVLSQPWVLGLGIFCSSKSYWHSHQQNQNYIGDFKTKKGDMGLAYPEQLMKKLSK